MACLTKQLWKQIIVNLGWLIRIYNVQRTIVHWQLLFNQVKKGDISFCFGKYHIHILNHHLSLSWKINFIPKNVFGMAIFPALDRE